MPYIGVSPFNGVRKKHTYTATANQTSFSGVGAEGITLSYKDSTFVDVFQNGVKLGEADYTSTSGTAIVLGTGAAVNDIVEVVVFDVFSVADTVSKADGGTFDNNINVNGTVEINSTTTSDFLVVKTTEAGSGSAPDIVFARDSSSPADNDFLGKIVFRGKNDASEDVEYAQIVSQLIDASDGTEDGKLYLQTKVNGSDTNVAVIDSSGLTVSGAFTSQGIDDNANATAITIDANENVGFNNTNPDQFVTTGKVVAIQGTANNSGSASLHLNGNTDGSGYYNTQVFAVSGITSATEITRYTGTGANGFRAYFKIIATGHTASVNNGINIKEYYYDGSTGNPVEISSYTATSAPVIAFDNSTSNVLIVTLSSSNGSNGFNGVVKIEALIPIDFGSSTWTIS